MTGGKKAELMRSLKRALEVEQWSVEFEYSIIYKGRRLRADAVLFIDGRVAGVIEVKPDLSLRRNESAVAFQIQQVAQALGAPFAFIWTNQGITEVDTVILSLTRLQSLPTLAGLRQRLTQLLGWTGTIHLCNDVAMAVHTWKSGGGTRIPSVTLGALDYYNSEFQLVCNLQSAPLIQCVLIGGMYESILRDVFAHSGILTGTRVTLGALIKKAVTSGILTASVTDIAPNVIVGNRNSLHPDNFAANPIVGHGIALNSVSALTQAVNHLDFIV